MEGMVTLNREEQRRLMVLNEVGRGRLGGRQAAEVLKLSLRQSRRLIVAYRKEGAQALAHGNRGRKPPNAIEEELRQQVLELASCKYSGFNHQHFTELLAEREDIFLSRSSVRNILLESGIRSPRKRRPPKHRSRRERYPKSGMLLQTDGSPHDWLEDRGPRLCLIGAIDDATGEVVYAHFQPQENTAGYIRMLRSITSSHGLPLALYHDRHSIFEVLKGNTPTLEEQLAGKRPQTQLARILAELGINSISAHSPQAKGRVERLWGTFQDRLVSELRLAGVSTEKEANRILIWFVPDYNRRFMVQAKESGSAYRQPIHDFKPEEIFCYKYTCKVGIDNVVSLGEKRLQILPTVQRQSYARCRVEVQARLDDSLGIYFEGQPLKTRPAPLEATALRKQASPITPSTSQKQLTPDPLFNPWKKWVYR